MKHWNDFFVVVSTLLHCQVRYISIFISCNKMNVIKLLLLDISAKITKTGHICMTYTDKFNLKWCTETTQRDGVGRGEGEFRIGNMCMYGKSNPIL